jgi:diphthamide biosynthesis methyltransferase
MSSAAQSFTIFTFFIHFMHVYNIAQTVQLSILLSNTTPRSHKDGTNTSLNIRLHTIRGLEVSFIFQPPLTPVVTV